MHKDSILIFGGGDNQLTLIKAAKKRNYHTVVIDPYKNAPGRNFADAFEIVGAKDFETTCRIVEKYYIKGIATAQMENPLLLMSQVAEKYGLLFPSVEQIKLARNKFLMKKAFLSNGVPCAQGVLYKKEDEITESSLKDFNYPVIIKPADAFSSRGVLKIASFEEIKKYEGLTRSFSSDGSLILEEFLEGPEYSIEALTFNHSTHIIQHTEKIITSFPYTVEMGHIQPAELTPAQKTAVDDAVKKSICSLGLNNCASHTELKITDKGPKIIEIGARLGGDYIASYLTLSSTGIDMDAAAVDIAMGNEPAINIRSEQYSGIFYFHTSEGKKVNFINDWRGILNEPDVVHANIFISEGDIVPPLTDSAKRTGFVILKGKKKDEMLKRKEVLISRLAESIHFYE